jgi:hypothetical protein
MKPGNKTIFTVILALLFQIPPSAQAAPTVVFNGLMTGCDIVFTGSSIYANRLLASTTTTITGINIKVGTGLNSNWSTTKYWIVSYNSSTDRPGVILETFTANSTSGSGASTLVNFTGSYTLTAGTKFYVFPNVTFNTFPVCYSNAPPAANTLPNAGINVDTTTTLSNATWTKAFISGVWPGANSSSWSINNSQAQLWALSLESNPSVPINVTLALASGGRTAFFRTSQSITATVDTPAYVTFYNNGKKISGCINVLSSAGSATCAWKPSTRGFVQLNAQAKPISGSYIENTTGKLEVLVSQRLIKR